MEIRPRAAVHGLHHGGLHSSSSAKHYTKSEEHRPNLHPNILLYQVPNCAFCLSLKVYLHVTWPSPYPSNFIVAVVTRTMMDRMPVAIGTMLTGMLTLLLRINRLSRVIKRCFFLTLKHRTKLDRWEMSYSVHEDNLKGILWIWKQKSTLRIRYCAFLTPKHTTNDPHLKSRWEILGLGLLVTIVYKKN